MVGSASTLVAQENADFKGLVQAFSSALASKDEMKIHEAWEAINNSATALAYLRQKEPQLFKSFEFWRIKRELQQFREDHGIPFHNRNEGGFSKSRSSKNRSNSERVHSFPNQDRSSNRSRALASPNQDRRPNQDVVHDIPNQDRISNQERIRNRL